MDITRRPFGRRITGLIFLMVLGAQPVWSQSTGILRGTVRDAQTNEPLIGATVLLEGTQIGTASDVDGVFEIPRVPTQTYTITASYVGYESESRFNLIVKSAGNSDLTFRLSRMVVQSDEVVVRPDPYIVSIETPLSTSRLSQVEIATYPGGNNDVAKVIQSLAGVSPSPAGFRNDVIIRGGAPNENVYYLDGIEIPNINHFATQGSAGGPVGLLNVSFFDEVTLSTSAFPAQFDNTLSSVLEFKQREGNARELQTNIRLGASEAALTVEGPLFGATRDQSSQTTFIASVRRSYLQLLFDLIGLPFLPDYWDYQYKISHRFDQRNEINLVGLGSIDDFRVNVLDSFDPEQQATLEQVPVIKQWTSTVGLSWLHRFKDFKRLIRTTVSTNVFDNDFRRYRDNENLDGLYLANDSREWDVKLRSQFESYSDRGTVKTGLLLQRTRYTNRSQDLVNGLDFSSELDYLRYGFFGQASWTTLAGRLSTSAGIRADGNTFTAKGHDLWETLSPRLSFSYSLDRDARWRANASVGRYFKLPPNTILGFRGADGTFLNRNTDYIRSDHIVAGLAHRPAEATQIALEGFYKRYDDYPVSVRDSISLANLGGDFEVFGNEEIRSIGKGRSYGFELSLQKKLTNRFYGIAAYTLYRSEFTGFDTDRYTPSAWDNRHLLSFTGGYKLSRNWEFGGRLRIAGPAPYAVLDS
ncbi:MAG: TonB-dependent receptor, partial [Rhodothermales bacterium]